MALASDSRGSARAPWRSAPGPASTCSASIIRPSCRSAPPRRRGDQPLGRLELVRGRAEGAVGGVDLAGMDHRLAVEAVGAALARIPRPAPRRPRAGCRRRRTPRRRRRGRRARSAAAHRRGPRRPPPGGRPRPAARSLVPAIRPALAGAIAAASITAARRLDHRQHRLGHQPAGVVHLLGRIRPWAGR